MTHTPGPWELDSAAWPLIVNGPMNEDDDSATVVCTVECLESTGRSTHYNEDEAAANARLIAVAPEMIAILQEILALYEGDVDLERVMNEAGCIVAKAKGEA